MGVSAGGEAGGTGAAGGNSGAAGGHGLLPAQILHLRRGDTPGRRGKAGAAGPQPLARGVRPGVPAKDVQAHPLRPGLPADGPLPRAADHGGLLRRPGPPPPLGKM